MIREGFKKSMEISINPFHKPVPYFSIYFFLVKKGVFKMPFKLF